MRISNPPNFIMKVSLIMKLIMTLIVFQCTPLALHGSLYAPNRGVYVRLQSAIFGGCVICDHDNDIGAKGSQEWQNYNTQHRGMTARESRAAAQMRGGLNAWWAQNPGRR